MGIAYAMDRISINPPGNPDCDVWDYIHDMCEDIVNLL